MKIHYQNHHVSFFIQILIRALVIFFPLAVFSNTVSGEVNCSKDTLCIETEKTGQAIHFYATNKKAFTLSSQIEVQKTNMVCDVRFPHIFVLKGYEKRLLFTLKYGRKAWKYTFTYLWKRGDIKAMHDDSYIYGLPYPKSHTSRIVQSCNGSYTHFGEFQYAIDFEMPVGSVVCAAREGVVVGVKDDSDTGGPYESMKDLANYILIEHSDGTTGEYYHFKHKGVLPVIGQSVEKGEIIGYSGNTGYSSGPHLHFAVHSAASGKKRVSHAVQFLTQEGLIRCPMMNSRLSEY